MKHVLALSMDLNLHGYDNERAAEFHRQLIERLRALPGVKAVSVTSLTPLGGVSRTAPVTAAESNGPVGASETSLGYWVVSPDYFATLSIPHDSFTFFEPDTTVNSSRTHRTVGKC